MTKQQREDAMRHRVQRGGSWRRPPVWGGERECRFLITAACFEHADHIGTSPTRMSAFEDALLTTLDAHSTHVFAHVLLPNHYHALVDCPDVAALRSALGRLHGRSSRAWNLEDRTNGRKVFHGSAETRQKSEGHFRASMNYVHHNPVRHGYVRRWQDWPWSSAAAYLNSVGMEEAERLWRTYPIDTYGNDWD